MSQAITTPSRSTARAFSRAFSSTSNSGIAAAELDHTGHHDLEPDPKLPRISFSAAIRMPE